VTVEAVTLVFERTSTPYLAPYVVLSAHPYAVVLRAPKGLVYIT